MPGHMWDGCQAWHPVHGTLLNLWTSAYVGGATIHVTMHVRICCVLSHVGQHMVLWFVILEDGTDHHHITHPCACQVVHNRKHVVFVRGCTTPWRVFSWRGWRVLANQILQEKWRAFRWRVLKGERWGVARWRLKDDQIRQDLKYEYLNE